MIHVVYRLQGDADITDNVRRVDAGAYVTYAPAAFFLEFPGTASSLQKLLATGDYQPTHFLVAPLDAQKMFGQANSDLWEWVIERASR